MAYQTGTAVSLDALFTTLDTFLTTQAGWTLVDTVANTAGSRDKVYSSPGLVAGRAPAVVRLMTPKYTGSLVAPQIRDYVKWQYPGITGMGYRSWTVGAAASAAASPDPVKAIAEYGMLKEWRGFVGGNSGGIANVDVFAFPGSNANVITQRLTLANYLGWSVLNNNTRLNYTNPMTWWLGARYVVARKDNASTSNFSPIGIFQTNAFSSTGAYNSWVNNVRCIVPVVDKTTCIDYLYCTTQNGLNQSFYKFNVLTQVYTALADPPWGGTGVTHNNSQMLWDGDDSIYILRGDGTASFAKYTISTNSWISLANAPATIVNSAAANETTLKPFIWKAANSGAAEDVLYFAGANTSAWYAYKVTTAAWSATNPAAFPSGTDYQGCGDFDGDYYWRRLSDQNTSLDVSIQYIYTPAFGAAGSWLTSASGRLTSQASLGQTSLDFLAQPLCFLPCPSAAGTYTYWMFGNGDSVTVAIKVPAGTGQTPNYWWMHFGYLDSPWVTDSRSITGTVSPGFGVAVTVNSANPNWVPGDRVMLFDTASSNCELVTVSSVVGTTVTLQQVTLSYTNAYIGKDPHPVTLTSNARFAAMSSSATSYRAKGLYDWYRCMPIPLSTGAFEWNIPPNNRFGYRLWPYEVYNFDPNYPDTYEVRGKVKTVYTTKSGPNNEDILQIGSSQYLCFTDYNARGMPDNRITVIGPLA